AHQEIAARFRSGDAVHKNISSRGSDIQELEALGVQGDGLRHAAVRVHRQASAAEDSVAVRAEDLEAFVGLNTFDCDLREIKSRNIQLDKIVGINLIVLVSGNADTHLADTASLANQSLRSSTSAPRCGRDSASVKARERGPVRVPCTKDSADR